MIKKFLQKHGWKYIPGVIFLAINSRIATLAPKALGDAINMLEGALPEARVIYIQALIIVAIALGIFATRFVWRMFIVMNARRMEVFLREELFTKLQSLPLSFFAKQRSGDMMAYAINDVGAVRMTFGPALAQGLNGIITGTLAIWSMIAEVDWRMTALALIPVPIAVATIIIIGGRVQKRSRRVQELFQKLSGFVNESIMGVRVVKTFAREEEWSAEFEATSDEMRDANIKLADTSALLNPITVITFGISYAISLIVGGTMVMNGQLAIGDLVEFQGYLLLIQMPVVALGRIVNMLHRGLASYKRLSTVYNEPSIPDFETSEYRNEIEGEIEAKNLTFTYPGMHSPALQSISFKLKRGGTLGIAGGTGSGKTTLAALMMKFYDTPRGSLFIDGADINDIPAKAIREATGFVPQDGFLFSAPIEDNIIFYSPDKTREDMLHAAEMANIRTEIEEFPEGFKTEVGERGTHLSGGQKQRISLARALVRDPQILIFDDTLSAVDNLTERKIVANLNGALAKKTAVIISHRLSALRDADLIIFLEDGEIIESGSHDELIEIGGAYASTYSKQAKESEKEITETAGGSAK